MTFSLNVDTVKFRHHLNAVVTDCRSAGGQVVPVIKGNGYGFTRKVLAAEANSLELKRIAIGTVWELAEALAQFPGEIVVLEPFNAADDLAISQWKLNLKNNASRVILTLSDLNFSAATQAGATRIYLEGLTSLRRFGISQSDFLNINQNALGNLSVVGLSLHLPIVDSAKPTGAITEVSSVVDSNKLSGKVLEVWNWIIEYQEIATAQSLPMHISLSHISLNEIKKLKDMCASYNYVMDFDLRLGTSLWLGAPDALTVSGTILQIHDVKTATQIGYQQVTTSGHDRLIVVSGGTSHGVALAAPTARSTFRKRGIAVAEGFAQAFGKVRSPFSSNGHNLLFAEPPHMHVSLLWAKDSSDKIGDELVCNVRNTTIVFDQIRGLS